MPDVLRAAHASLHQLHVQYIYTNHCGGDFFCRFKVRTHATAAVSLVKRNRFLLFWERRRNHQRPLRDLTCGFLVATIDETYQWLAVKAAVWCLLLTMNAADNKHHALAKSLSMFETSTQMTDRRHSTPFPNTNEVECMPTTSLHDLPDSMHNTLSQLQIAASRACDVIYSLIRISSPWPAFLAMKKGRPQTTSSEDARKEDEPARQDHQWQEGSHLKETGSKFECWQVLWRPNCEGGCCYDIEESNGSWV